MAKNTKSDALTDYEQEVCQAEACSANFLRRIDSSEFDMTLCYAIVETTGEWEQWL